MPKLTKLQVQGYKKGSKVTLPYLKHNLIQRLLRYPIVLIILKKSILEKLEVK